MRHTQPTFADGVRPRRRPVYDLLTPADLIAAEHHWALAPSGDAVTEHGPGGDDPVPVVAWSAANGVMIIGDVEESPPAYRLSFLDRLVCHLASPIGRGDMLLGFLLALVIILSGVVQ
jgi:hypothetical protein